MTNPSINSPEYFLSLITGIDSLTGPELEQRTRELVGWDARLVGFPGMRAKGRVALDACRARARAEGLAVY